MRHTIDHQKPSAIWVRPLRIWSLVAVVSITLLSSATQFALDRSREAWLNQGREKVAGLASSYRSQIEDSLEQLDQITWFIGYLHAQRASSQMFRQVFEGVPSHKGASALFAGPDGRVQASTHPAAIGESIAQLSFFRNHLTSASIALVISPVETGGEQQADQKLIRLSRRLNDDQGRMLGVVVVSIEPGSLLRFGGDNELKDGDAIALRFADGEWLMRQVIGEGRTARSHLGEPELLGSDQVFVGTINGEPAQIAWSKFQYNPLHAFVGINLDNALREHSETELAYRVVQYGFCLLALLLCGVFGWMHWRRDERLQREERVRNTFRLAVDGAREELYMVSPTAPDAMGKISFRIEDCNGQASRMTGKDRAMMIGKPLDDVLMIGGRVAVEQMLTEALEKGFAEAELDIYRTGPRQTRWYHCRAVSADLGLAVTLRDITELKDKENQLRELALSDPLTRLPNRRWMQVRLPELLEQAKADGQRFAALFIDLDNFKMINDTLGHRAGDQFLKEIAACLRAAVRKQDHVLRLGGDEFMVLLQAIERRETALEIAVHLLEKLAGIKSVAGVDGVRPRASIGLAFYPDDAIDADTLVQAADIAMYEAKRAGKGRVTTYTVEMLREISDRVTLEAALTTAVTDNQLLLYLQPRASAMTGRLVGFEALVRWQHPRLGLISPERFIPLAEESHLISEIGDWVAERACAILASWRERKLGIYPVSINVSVRQLTTSAFRLHLQQCMARHAILPSQLAIELTESAMVGDNDAVRNELSALERLGMRLMIDDFGTGYSSLARLHRLNVDVLKIDQSFVQNLSPDSESYVLCHAMTQLARSLGIATVAEGVETAQQLRMLRMMGCDEIQGYLASPPVPANMAEAWLEGAQFFEPMPASGLTAGLSGTR
jgi:diguanylate cyclase (GGDEF)-like protein